jgi:formate hydrogenlyase transcriptional activator
MAHSLTQHTGSNRSDVAPRVADELTALRAIVEGTAHSIGEEFLERLVRHLARAVDVNYAFVAEFAAPETTTRARTIAYWSTDHIAENVEWSLAGTPCEEVLHGTLCHYASGVRQSFPDDRSLVERRIESYLGVPLRDPDGKVLGHLAVFDDRPMTEEPRKLLTFQVFAARAAAELVHLRLERQLRDSEERLRDLYEEAPIAYVKEDLESRFMSANRAAQRILGIKPEDVVGLVGLSLVPNRSSSRFITSRRSSAKARSCWTRWKK